PAATARSAWRIEATSANTSAPASCNGPITGAGDPTDVITISGRCRSSTCRSCSSRALERCTIRLAQTGADGLPLASACAFNLISISASHCSNCSGLRQFTVGNEPITPLRHAATTSSTPETRNIGAAISGRLRRSRKRERASTGGKTFLPYLSRSLVVPATSFDAFSSRKPVSASLENAIVPPRLARAKANYKNRRERKNEQSALCVSGGVRADLAGAGALPRTHRVQLAGRIDHLSRRDRHDRPHPKRLHATGLCTRHPPLLPA